MYTLQKSPFKNLLDGFFNDFDYLVDANYQLQTKTINNENEFLIGISVPGLKKDDVKVSLDNKILYVEYSPPETKKEFNFTSAFKKSFYIPDDVDETSISGTIEDGILKISLPKTKKKPSQRLITVN
jgi:HSP20 family molecular chaperone IbpA